MASLRVSLAIPLVVHALLAPFVSAQYGFLAAGVLDLVAIGIGLALLPEWLVRGPSATTVTSPPS